MVSLNLSIEYDDEIKTEEQSKLAEPFSLQNQSNLLLSQEISHHAMNASSSIR